MSTFGHGRHNALYKVLYLIFIKDIVELTTSCKPNFLGLMFIGVKHIRTVTIFLHKDLFRLDPFYNRNRLLQKYAFLLYKHIFSIQKTKLRGGPRENNNHYIFKQQVLSKYVFVNLIFNKSIDKNIFIKKYYSYKNINKIDVKLTNLFWKFNRQETELLITKDLRQLYSLKKKILYKNNYLTPLLISCLKKNIWPILKHAKLIFELVNLRQTYLSILSNKYGIHSKYVKKSNTELID